MTKLLRRLKRGIGIPSTQEEIIEDVVESLLEMRRETPDVYLMLLAEYAYGLSGRLAPPTVSGAATKALVSGIVASRHRLPKGEEGAALTLAIKEKLWHSVSDQEREMALTQLTMTRPKHRQ